MVLFSERYGYKNISDVIIREQITPEIENAICSSFDRLEQILKYSGYNFPKSKYIEIEQYIWTEYLNRRLNDFDSHLNVIIDYIQSPYNEWYEVLDLVEFVIKYLYHQDIINYKQNKASHNFCQLLNHEFKRLNFAYRVVEQEIVEITSESEIKAIENAIDSSPRNIKMHLNSALEKYAQKPNGDYRNSIKESISAVEAFCRAKTGEDTLGKALNKLKESNIIIPPLLKTAFEKLYAYTNQQDTGIRHALMEDSANYTPTADEALFMLVSCSAFINYLSKKV